ncbi:AAA family ATPase [Erwinia amylovora]|uniref:McrB family protein n=1 Tax=Erwinia amylovora TaxID=552 RepID=UPI00200A419E|nr:AAA family ATPase [Erwinia amylovora]MCK8380240.1 AAA family ATPase [Erwinia amylovora]
MFFSEDVIRKSFEGIKKIDSSNGKSRMEKISGLRYLLATSMLLKRTDQNEIDMKVGSEYRDEFIKTVGEVVSLDSQGLYTKDFNSEFDVKKDYGIGSNFYTTRLAYSRSQVINYPGRPAPLLKLAYENIAIQENVKNTLEKSYNIDSIKVALCIWLMRGEGINIDDIKSPNETILGIIELYLRNNFTADVYKSLVPDLNDVNLFFTNIKDDYFSPNKFYVEVIKDERVIDQIENKVEFASVEDKSILSEKDILVLEDNLNDDDPILIITQKLLSKGAKGILFSGPPGTSKTWYALKIALKLTSSDMRRIERIQFHPSYSYEDFIEGLVPNGAINSSEPLFKPKHKIFLEICKRAREDIDNSYFLIIDEFSRGEPSKIFGELLTYIEPDYRDISFILPYSEEHFSIPQNIVIFATMNPYDRSVVELDSAMERRFEIIEMEPSQNILRSILQQNILSGEKIGKILLFFSRSNELSTHGFGHTYFKNIESDDDLLLLWNHKLKFIFSKMFKFNPETYTELKQLFMDILDEEFKDEIK